MALAALAAVIVGAVIYRINAPHLNIVAVELGGRGQPYPLPAQTSSALRWDFLFILGYGIALNLGTYVARFVAHTPMATSIVRAGQIAAAVAVVADFLENLFLLTVTGHPGMSHGSRSVMLDAASVSAVLKFCAFIPAAAIALTGIVLTVIRCMNNSPRRLREWSEKDIEYKAPHAVEGDPAGPAGPVPESNDGVRWRAGFEVPDAAAITTTRAAGKPVVGFCLSGGGVRAGSVALGVLQEMRSSVLDANYLVSVSGGGYTAGAFSQALTGCEPSAAESDNDSMPGTVLRDPSRTLSAGSVDEDHIRRHSSYLASTTTELVVALGLVMRHLVLSLTVLFGPAVVAGVLLGWFYRYVPIADLARLRPEGTSEFKTPFLIFPADALIVLGGVAAVAMTLWLFSQFAAAHRSPKVRALRHASRYTTMLGVVVAAMIVVIPLLASTAAWLLSLSRGVVHVAIGGPVGSLLLTYLATLASVGWRKRTTIAKQVKGVTAKGDSSSMMAAVPTGIMQKLFVAATLVLLGAGWLMLFGGMMLTHGDPAALWSAVVVGAVVVVLGGIIDETTLSLHPFYRARIASAFAVRTLQRASDGQIVAAPYRPEERTTLSEYGRVAEGIRFPTAMFAATANLTGEYRTAPGRNATSYLFSADWVGGPDVGWIRTSDLEALATPRLQRDLTVQGAVAVSGAAFASAMGQGARWFQILLAISGARLGAWLPNPAFVKEAHDRARADDWRYPRLPHTRRLSYLLREIFAIHPYSDRLLQITDGGHYENLGLVELLRRRCSYIYCVDASGDSPPTATTLSQAITLAHDELGVTITLDQHPFDSEPGSGTAIEPKDPLSVLNARLSKTPIITGTITYPPEAGITGPTDPPATGHLIVAKTLLWDDMPYSMLSYAAKHPVFPHDSTGDQWFDAGQFSAYTDMGRLLGQRIRTMEHERQPNMPHWREFETGHDRDRMVARFNVDAATIAGEPDYGTQVSVVVPLHDPQDDGMPASAESMQLDAIERTIVELIAGQGVFVGVITTGGTREFVVYSTGADWIPGFADQLGQKIATHQVNITAQLDPSWILYNRFVARLMAWAG